MYLRYGMHTNLMAVVPHLLHLLVVRVLMRNIKRRLDTTSIRILPLRCEQLLRVQLPVLGIDGIVECENNHLRHLIRFEATRNQRSILGAETIRQCACHWIAGFGSVRIIVHVTPAFIRTVRTVNGSIAEVLVRQASSIAAAQMVGLSALGLFQQGLRHASLFFTINK